MRMYFISSPSVLSFRLLPGTVLFMLQTGPSDCRLHGPLHFLAGLSLDRVSRDEDQIVSCRQRTHQPVAFLHKPSGPVALDSISHFLACKKSSAGIVKTVLLVEKDHIPVPYRSSFVIHRAEFTAACEHFLPAHTCTTKIRTSAYADSLFLPLALLFFRMLRPLLVFILLRKPCSFFLCRVLGWKVIFIIYSSYDFNDCRADLNSKPHIHTPN